LFRDALYTVIARENFPLRVMGTIIGGTAMAGGLGMATGPLTGGLIYDTFASYGWLFIGSFGLGIGAFLIALAFKPFAEVGRSSATGSLLPEGQR
jgi:MFS family permease